ncbi:hypothetical protein PtrEW7m1_011460, partial [Pyrenophora tritici-repentis]
QLDLLVDISGERVQRRYSEQLMRSDVPVFPRSNTEDTPRISRRCAIRELDTGPVVQEGLQQHQPPDLDGLAKTVNAHTQSAAKGQTKDSTETQHGFYEENVDDGSLGEEFEMVDYEEDMVEGFEEILGHVPSASNGAEGQKQGGF